MDPEEEEASSAASLLFLSRLEGNSDIRNDSWRLKGDVRDCKRLNSRKEVCLCNMRSVAWGLAMAKGLASPSSLVVGLGGGSNDGLMPCKQKNRWKNALNFSSMKRILNFIASRLLLYIIKIRESFKFLRLSKRQEKVICKWKPSLVLLVHWKAFYSLMVSLVYTQRIKRKAASVVDYVVVNIEHFCCSPFS